MTALLDTLHTGAQAVLWIGVSVAAYAAALRLYRWRNASPFLIPVATGAALLVAILLASGVRYQSYREAIRPLEAMLGPATVALAVPLYRQLERLRRIWLPLTFALAIGCIGAVVSAVGIAWAFGGTPELLVSLAPKSATMPLAIPVAERLGGQPSLAAVAVAFTGVVGAVATRPLMHRVQIEDDRVRGFVSGLTAHAIGVARELQVSPVGAGFAALAMCLNGMATALFVPIAHGVMTHWLGWLA
ncbi:MAG TPA: LrgB family protein [Ottowia sp.]|uniref:LrgB family protein n=1 Tax=Ottowia sp. TaxID=1898956 RepID=UPI002B826FDD|nr:LrgB family protein [Ottowia sp.]HMN20754.1 LrgB family protein [Ottowia sp.]